MILSIQSTIPYIIQITINIVGASSSSNNNNKKRGNDSRSRDGLKRTPGKMFSKASSRVHRNTPGKVKDRDSRSPSVPASKNDSESSDDSMDNILFNRSMYTAQHLL